MQLWVGGGVHRDLEQRRKDVVQQLLKVVQQPLLLVHVVQPRDLRYNVRAGGGGLAGDGTGQSRRSCVAQPALNHRPLLRAHLPSAVDVVRASMRIMDSPQTLLVGYRGCT